MNKQKQYHTDSCTKYELYFNDAIDDQSYGCVNINDLSNYQYRVKGQRDQRSSTNSRKKYPIYKLQKSLNDKCKWKTWNSKYFNVKHDYRLIIDEKDSKLDSKLAKSLVCGYIRHESYLKNKGFKVIVGVINKYYNNGGYLGYINMEQVVKRELYFTPSVSHHYYGCVKSDKPLYWHYRFQGNCVKRVNDEKYRCYKIQHRAQDEMNRYKQIDDDETEFNVNYQYRIRLIRNGGYIVVERVTKNALYFGVSISKFWAGCIEIDNTHSWHYVNKSTKELLRVGKGNYSVYSVECKQ